MKWIYSRCHRLLCHRRRARRKQKGMEKIVLFSMLRKEFEAVVSMLMNVPRSFVRDRGAQRPNR